MLYNQWCHRRCNYQTGWRSFISVWMHHTDSFTLNVLMIVTKTWPSRRLLQRGLNQRDTWSYGFNQQEKIVQNKEALINIGTNWYLCVLCVPVLPDSPNFPYRRYDRLPPISQFSIESDSDLSETAELIEEYEVFDPSRPRPKVILVIGKGPAQHICTHTSVRPYARGRRMTIFFH